MNVQAILLLIKMKKLIKTAVDSGTCVYQNLYVEQFVSLMLNLIFENWLLNLG